MTSNHEGVSCNSCRKNNFRLRYKCLICYDYDLCSACYEAGLTSSRHTLSHPMQCTVARKDYDLFYSGEPTSLELPQSLTCPLCGRPGFTVTTMIEHVASEHFSSQESESSLGVICPICGIESSQITCDFASHLNLEHKNNFSDQGSARDRGTRCQARTGGIRGRRFQPQYNGLGISNTSGNSSLLVRDCNDQLAGILAQMSNVRRAAGAMSSQSSASQLHQLQMQLQHSPQLRPSNEVRVMRRTFQSMNNRINNSSLASSSPMGSSNPYMPLPHHCESDRRPFVLMDENTPRESQDATNPASMPSRSQPSASFDQASDQESSLTTQFLLPKCIGPTLTENELEKRATDRADRSLFVQELLLQFGVPERNSK